MPLDNFGRNDSNYDNLTWDDLAGLLKDDMAEIKPAIKKTSEVVEEDKHTQKEIEQSTKETAKGVTKLTTKFDKVLALLNRLTDRNLKQEAANAQNDLDKAADIVGGKGKKDRPQTVPNWDMAGITKTIEAGLRGIKDQMDNIFKTSTPIIPVRQPGLETNILPVLNKLVQTIASGSAMTGMKLDEIKKDTTAIVSTVAGKTPRKVENRQVTEKTPTATGMGEKLQNAATAAGVLKQTVEKSDIVTEVLQKTADVVPGQAQERVVMQTAPLPPPKAFGTGGAVVPGPMSVRKDIVPAFLEKGGFVLNRNASDLIRAQVMPGETVFGKDEAQRIGVDKLNDLNKAVPFSTGGPNFAEGGSVRMLNAGSSKQQWEPLSRQFQIDEQVLERRQLVKIINLTDTDAILEYPDQTYSQTELISLIRKGKAIESTADTPRKFFKIGDKVTRGGGKYTIEAINKYGTYIKDSQGRQETTNIDQLEKVVSSTFKKGDRVTGYGGKGVVLGPYGEGNFRIKWDDEGMRQGYIGIDSPETIFLDKGPLRAASHTALESARPIDIPHSEVLSQIPWEYRGVQPGVKEVMETVASNILSKQGILPNISEIQHEGDDFSTLSATATQGVHAVYWPNSPWRAGQVVFNKDEAVAAADDPKIGGKLLDPSLTGIATHEIGHIKFRQAPHPIQSKLLTAMRNLETTAPDFQQWLSSRGVDNEDEFMAELSAAYFKDDHKLPPAARTLAKQLWQAPVLREKPEILEGMNEDYDWELNKETGIEKWVKKLTLKNPGNLASGGFISGMSSGGSEGLLNKVTHFPQKVLEKGVSYLPEKGQKVANATGKGVKGAMKLAYLPYIIGEHLAEQVSLSKGSKPEEAKALRMKLLTGDLLAVKGVPALLTAMGMPGLALPASFVPIASTAYLASNPLTTTKVIYQQIADMLNGRKQTIAEEPNIKARKTQIATPEEIAKSLNPEEPKTAAPTRSIYQKVTDLLMGRKYTINEEPQKKSQGGLISRMDKGGKPEDEEEFEFNFDAPGQEMTTLYRGLRTPFKRFDTKLQTEAQSLEEAYRNWRVGTGSGRPREEFPEFKHLEELRKISKPQYFSDYKEEAAEYAGPGGSLVSLKIPRMQALEVLASGLRESFAFPAEDVHRMGEEYGLDVTHIPPQAARDVTDLVKPAEPLLDQFFATAPPKDKANLFNTVIGKRVSEINQLLRENPKFAEVFKKWWSRLLPEEKARRHPRLAKGGAVGMVPGKSATGKEDNFITTVSDKSYVISQPAVKSLGAKNIMSMLGTYAKGGHVVALTPEEIVVPPDIAGRVGLQTLDAINTGRMPIPMGLAKGGATGDVGPGLVMPLIPAAETFDLSETNNTLEDVEDLLDTNLKDMDKFIEAGLKKGSIQTADDDAHKSLDELSKIAEALFNQVNDLKAQLAAVPIFKEITDPNDVLQTEVEKAKVQHGDETQTGHSKVIGELVPHFVNVVDANTHRLLQDIKNLLDSLVGDTTTIEIPKPEAETKVEEANKKVTEEVTNPAAPVAEVVPPPAPPVFNSDYLQFSSEELQRFAEAEVGDILSFIGGAISKSTKGVSVGKDAVTGKEVVHKFTDEEAMEGLTLTISRIFAGIQKAASTVGPTFNKGLLLLSHDMEGFWARMQTQFPPNPSTPSVPGTDTSTLLRQFAVYTLANAKSLRDLAKSEGPAFTPAMAAEIVPPPVMTPTTPTTPTEPPKEPKKPEDVLVNAEPPKPAEEKTAKKITKCLSVCDYRTHRLLENIQRMLLTCCKGKERKEQAKTEQVKSEVDKRTVPQTETTQAEKEYKPREYSSRDIVRDAIAKVRHYLDSITNQILGYNPLNKITQDLVKNEMEFRRAVDETLYVQQGVTMQQRDLQKEYELGAPTIQGQADRFRDIAKITGQDINTNMKVYVKLLRMGIKDQKVAYQQMLNASSVSRQIGSNAEETAEMFGTWTNELMMSGNQGAQMARTMVEIGRSTGLSGDNLLRAAKNTQSLLIGLRNAGNLSSETARNFMLLSTGAQRIGIGEEMNRYLRGVSSGMNLFNGQMDNGVRSMLAIASNFSGVNLFQEIMFGRGGMRQNLQATSRGLRAFLQQQWNIRTQEDMQRLDDYQRMALQNVLGQMGLDLGTVFPFLDQLDEASRPFAAHMQRLETAVNNAGTATARQLAQQQQQELVTSELFRGLTRVQELSSRTGGNIAEAFRQLTTQGDNLDESFTQLMQHLNIDASNGINGLRQSILTTFNRVRQGFVDAGRGSEFEIDASAVNAIMADLEAGGDRAVAAGGRFNTLLTRLNQAQQQLSTMRSATQNPMTQLDQSIRELTALIQGLTSGVLRTVIDNIGAFGLAIMAVGAVVGTLLLDFLTFSKTVSEFSRTLKTAGIQGNVLSAILWAVMNPFQALGAIANKVAYALGYLAGIAPTVSAAFKDLPIFKSIKIAFAPISKWITTIITKAKYFLDFLVFLLVWLVKIFSETKLGMLLGKIGSELAGWANTVSKLIAGIGPAIAGIIAKAKYFLDFLAFLLTYLAFSFTQTNFGAALVGWITKIGSRLAGIFEFILKAFTNVFRDIAPFFRSLVTNVGIFFAEIGSGLLETVKVILGPLGSKIAGMFEGVNLGGFFSGIKNMFFEGLTKGAAAEGLAKTFGPVGKLFSTLGHAVGRIAGPLAIVLGLFEAFLHPLKKLEKEASMLENILFGVLTGSTDTGSFMSGWLGIDKGSIADEAMGIATAAVQGATLGAMLMPLLGPLAPLGPLIGALVSVLVELYKISEYGTSSLRQSLAYFRSWINDIKNLIGNIVDLFKGAFDVIVGMFKGDSVLIQQGMNKIGNAVMGIVTNLVKVLFKGIDLAMQGLIWLITNLPKLIFDALGNIISQWLPETGEFVKKLGEVLAGVGKVIGGIWDMIAGLISFDWRRVWSGLRDAVYYLIEPIADAFSVIPQMTLEWIDTLGRFLMNFPTMVQGWFGQIDFKEAGKNIVRAIVLAIGDFINSITDLFKGDIKIDWKWLAKVLGGIAVVVAAALVGLPAIITVALYAIGAYIIAVLGEVILKGLGDLVRGIGDELAEIFPALGAIFRGLGGILSGVGEALGGLVDIVGGLFGLITGQEGAWDRVVDGITKFFSGLGGIIVAALQTIVPGLIGAIMQILTEIILVPFRLIGWALEGIFGWTGLTDVIQAISSSVHDFVKTVTDWFQWLFDKLVGHSIIPKLINALLFWFGGLIDVIGGVARVVRGIMALDFREVLAGFGSVAIALLKLPYTIVQAVYNLGVVIATAISGWLDDIADYLADTPFGDFIKNLSGWFADLGQYLGGLAMYFDGITDVISGIFSWDWNKIGEGIGKMFSGLWDAVLGLIKLIWKLPSLIIEGLASLGEALTRLVSGWLNTIADALGGEDTFLGSFIKGMSDTWAAVSRIFGGLKDFFGGFVQLISGIFSLDVDKIVASLGRMWGGFTSIIGGLWDYFISIPQRIFNYFMSINWGAVGQSILDFFSALPGQIRNILGSIDFRGMSKAITKGIRNIIDWIRNIDWRSVGQWIKEQAQKIVDWIKSIDLRSVGQWIKEQAQKIIDWIKGIKWRAVVQWINELPGKIVDWIKDVDWGEVIKGIGIALAVIFLAIPAIIAGLASLIIGSIGEAIFGGIGDALDEWADELDGYFGGFIHGLAEVFHGIGDIFGGIAEVAEGVLSLDFDKIMSGFDKIGEGIARVFTGMGVALINAIGGLGEVAITALGDLTETVLSWVGIDASGLTDSLVASWNNFFNFMLSIPDRIIEAFDFSGMFEDIKNIFGGIGDFFSGLFSWDTDKMGEAVEQIFSSFIGLSQKIGDGILGLIDGILQDVFDIDLSSVLDTLGITQFVEGLTNAFLGVYNIIAGIFNWDLDQVLEGFDQLGEGLLDILLSIPTALWDSLQYLWQWLTNIDWSSVFSGMFRALTNVGRAILNFIKDIPETLTEFAADIKTIFINAIRRTWAFMQDQFITFIRNLIEAIPESIRDIMGITTQGLGPANNLTTVEREITAETNDRNVRRQAEIDRRNAETRFTSQFPTQNVTNIESWQRPLTTVRSEMGWNNLLDSQTSRALQRLPSLAAQEAAWGEEQTRLLQQLNRAVEDNNAEEARRLLQQLASGRETIQYLRMEERFRTAPAAQQAALFTPREGPAAVDRAGWQAETSNEAIQTNRRNMATAQRMFGNVNLQSLPELFQNANQMSPELTALLRSAGRQETQEQQAGVAATSRASLQRATQTAATPEDRMDAWRRLTRFEQVQSLLQQNQEQTLRAFNQAPESIREPSTRRLGGIEPPAESLESISATSGQTSRDIQTLTREASNPGSIYTHDTHIEKTINGLINAFDNPIDVNMASQPVLRDTYLRMMTGLLRPQEELTEAKPDWVDPFVQTTTVVTGAWNSLQTDIRKYLSNLLELEGEENQAKGSREMPVPVEPILPTIKMLDPEEEIRRRRAEIADTERGSNEEMEEVSENTADTAKSTADTAKALITVIQLLDVIRKLLAGGANLKGKKIGGVDIENLINGIDIDEVLNTDWNMQYVESATGGMMNL